MWTGLDLNQCHQTLQCVSNRMRLTVRGLWAVEVSLRCLRSTRLSYPSIRIPALWLGLIRITDQCVGMCQYYVGIRRLSIGI